MFFIRLSETNQTNPKPHPPKKNKSSTYLKRYLKRLIKVTWEQKITFQCNDCCPSEMAVNERENIIVTIIHMHECTDCKLFPTPVNLFLKGSCSWQTYDNTITSPTTNIKPFEEQYKVRVLPKPMPWGTVFLWNTIENKELKLALCSRGNVRNTGVSIF